MRQILKNPFQRIAFTQGRGKGGENQAKAPTTSIPIPVPPTRYPL